MAYEPFTFDTLMGRTLVRAEQVASDRIEFETDDGHTFAMFHGQDCCERVEVHDVNGDWADLVGSPIMFAEESTNESEWPLDVPQDECRDDSFTWTFYRIGTVKGTVVIRWYGSSNGYYSESVDFDKVSA